jgi:hypothetical protein
VQRKTSRLYVYKGNSVLKIAIWMQSWQMHSWL